MSLELQSVEIRQSDNFEVAFSVNSVFSSNSLRKEDEAAKSERLLSGCN